MGLGRQQEVDLEKKGYARDQIESWKSDTRRTMFEGGYSLTEIDDHFEIKRPDMAQTETYFKNNLKQFYEAKAAKEEGREVSTGPETPENEDQIHADSFLEYLEAGWQHSVSGLIARGRGPSVIAPEDAPMAYRIASQVATLAGDFPFMVMGGLAGGAAGGIAGTAAGPAGTATGLAIGGAGGGNALPTAMRKILMDHYERGDITTFQEFYERASSTLLESSKDFVTGAATFGVGAKVSKVLGSTAFSSTGAGVKTAARLMSEVATMTTVGAGLRGEMPDAKDFVEAGILVGGLHGAGYAVGKLREHYVKTGKKPAQTALDMEKDPTLKEQILATNSPTDEVKGLEGNGDPSEFTGTLRAAHGSEKEITHFDRPDQVDDSLRWDKGGGLSGRETYFDTKGNWVSVDGTDNIGGVATGNKGYHSVYGVEIKFKRALVISPETLGKALEVLGEVPSDVTFPAAREGKFDFFKEEFLIKRLKSKGYDGVIIKGMEDNLAAVDASFERQFPAPDKSDHTPYAEWVSKLLDNRAKQIPLENPSYWQDQVISFKPEENAKIVKTLGSGGTVRKAEVENFVKVKAEEVSPVEVKPEGDMALSPDALGGGKSENPIVMDPVGHLLDNEDGAVDLSKAKTPSNLTPDEQSFKDEFIGERQPKNKKTTKTSLYKDFVDDLHYIKKIVNFVSKAGEVLSAIQDPYILARTYRGFFGLADQILEHNVIDHKTGLPAINPKTGESYKGLMKILDPVKGELDGWKIFAVASRVVEKEGSEVTVNGQKKLLRTGADLEKAKRIVAAGKGKYEKITQEVHDYQNQVLKQLLDSEIIDQAAYDRILEHNKNYVPFYRLLEDGGSSRSAGPGGKVRQPVMKMKGLAEEELLKIHDPLESIIKNTYLYTQLAERNRVLRAYVDMALDSPYKDDLITKSATTFRGVEITPQEVIKMFEKQDIQISEADVNHFTAFRPAREPLAPDEIAVFRGGKREVYKIGAEAAEAFNQLDRQAAGTLIKILAKPASILRAGAILSPDFMFRNLIRDQISAFIFSKNGYMPFYHAFNGFRHFMAKDQVFQDWLTNGGANATMVEIDKYYIMDKFQLNKETGFLNAVKNSPKNALEMLKVVSEVIENSTRLGEFELAMKGKERSASNLKSAAFQSREVTLDFSRMGAKVKSVNMIVAFFNAQLQGVDKLGRAFYERPTQTFAKTFAAVTLPSLYLYYSNYGDPRMDEIPRWQKDLFWIIPTDKWVESTETQAAMMPKGSARQVDGKWETNQGTIWRVPKPQGVGEIFGSAIERSLDVYFGKHPEAFKGFGNTLMEAFVPDITPTAAIPFVEHWANKSKLTGQNIIPGHLEGLFPDLQYAHYTSETAKAISKLLVNIPGARQPDSLSSPMVMENYVRGWTGGLGSYLLQIADVGIGAARKMTTGSYTGSDVNRPMPALADIPFIKAFVVRYPGATAQSIQDFYDEATKVRTLFKSTDHLKTKMDAQGMKEEMLRMENRPYMMKVDGFQKAMTKHAQMIGMINDAPKMSMDDKRKLIDSLYYGMISMANAGNKALLKIKEATKVKK